MLELFSEVPRDRHRRYYPREIEATRDSINKARFALSAVGFRFVRYINDRSKRFHSGAESSSTFLI